VKRRCSPPTPEWVRRVGLTAAGRRCRGGDVLFCAIPRGQNVG
jgi:hypothetical protein